MKQRLLWPIFICYRQVDGSAAARRLHETLDKWTAESPEGQPIQLDVYLDETMPGVEDWRELHRPYLERARAMIVVCTPGARINEGGNDWVHMEIDWWMANREVAPILVDPLLQGTRYVPQQIAERWSDIQRIPLIEGEWTRLDKAALTQKSDALRRQVLGAILPSGAQIYQAELAAERRRVGRLRIALVVSAVLLLVAIVLGKWLKDAADEAQARQIDAEIAALIAEAEQLFARANFNDLLTERVRNMDPRSDREEYLKRLDRNTAVFRDRGDSKLELAFAIRNLDRDAQLDHLAELVDPAVEMTNFNVTAFRAGSGSALLIETDGSSGPFSIIYGGGPTRTARELVPRILEKAARNGDAVPVLNLIILPDQDDQHAGGILYLLQLLTEARSQTSPLPVQIDRLWHNFFAPIDVADTSAETPSLAVRQRLSAKDRLPMLAHKSNIPINQPFDYFVVSASSGPARVAFHEGLSIVVMGPEPDDLQRLEEFWKRGEGRAELWGGLSRIDVIGGLPRNYTSADISLIRAPEVTTEPLGIDRSVSNLASLLTLVEVGERTLLLAGDADGGQIIRGLTAAGLMKPGGNVQLDAMLVPHGGSDRNVSATFFRQVRADHYIFSADGSHTNPEARTLNWLLNARADDDRPYSLYFTHSPAEMLQHPDYSQHDERRSEFERAFAAIKTAREAGRIAGAHWPEDKAASISFDILKNQ